MRKSTKSWLKQKVAWILIVLMSINNFAATVGDNDGAAFITKAEFDSLKSTFQSQIDQYNSSIDNKIDGAISGYLSGIRIAKVTLLKNLVNDYNNIKWVKTWKIYGKWREWTNYNTKTESSGSVWFVPWMNDQRIGYRNGTIAGFLDNADMRIYSNLFNEGYMALGFKIQLQSMDNGFFLGARNNLTAWGSNTNQVPVSIVQLKRANDQLWYPDTNNPLWRAHYMYNYAVITAHTPASSGGGGAWWYNRELPQYLNTSLGDVLSAAQPPVGYVYRLAANYKWNSTTYSAHTQSPWFIDQPRFSDMEYAFNGNTMNYEPAAFDLNNYGLNNTEQNSVTTNYYNKGVHYNQMENVNSAQQKDYFLTMMLGADTNQVCNIGYEKTIWTNTTAYDMSTATSSCTVSGNIVDFNITHPIYLDKDTTRMDNVYHPATALPITLTFPLWPQLRLDAINSNYYKVKTTPLTLGQGIPLATDITADGILHVTADYTTSRILSTYTNTGIEVDVANKTFTDNKKEYLTGWEGDVSKETSEAELKRLSIDNSAKKLELSIRVKKDTDAWIRISPSNDDGGYYAQLSNLKVELVED